MANLVQECLLGRAATISIRNVGNWWMIGADVDWLAQGAAEAFERVISYQEAGPNSMRFEVALTVFANDVLPALDGEITWIKGDGRLFSAFRR
jgi:hypothetical protein